MLPKRPEPAVRPSAAPARPVKRERVEKYSDYRTERPKRRKKSKSFGRRVLSEIWDVVEDVVDEIFD